jgi:hypothetical protein
VKRSPMASAEQKPGASPAAAEPAPPPIDEVAVAAGNDRCVTRADLASVRCGALTDEAARDLVLDRARTGDRRSVSRRNIRRESEVRGVRLCPDLGAIGLAS